MSKKKKIGRNDPCPCGSGKKYKNCCLKKEIQTVDLFWRRTREALQASSDALLNFAEKRVGDWGLSVAAGEFFFCGLMILWF